ncbi:hypothetical protein C8Q76DRAFT_802966 [Earliella scabrosa]|nr:hypothetical protein C8Q76DRAFT_802966 [Earliella scabrosa]
MGPPLYSVRLRERETANLASIARDASDTPPPLSPDDGRDSPPPLMPVDGRESPPPLMGPAEPGRMDGENVDGMWAATSWPVPRRQQRVEEWRNRGSGEEVGVEESDNVTSGVVPLNTPSLEAFEAWARGSTPHASIDIQGDERNLNVSSVPQLAMEAS